MQIPHPDDNRHKRTNGTTIYITVDLWRPMLLLRRIHSRFGFNDRVKDAKSLSTNLRMQLSYYKLKFTYLCVFVCVYVCVCPSVFVIFVKHQWYQFPNNPYRYIYIVTYNHSNIIETDSSLTLYIPSDKIK